MLPRSFSVESWWCPAARVRRSQRWQQSTLLWDSYLPTKINTGGSLPALPQHPHPRLWLSLSDWTLRMHRIQSSLIQKVSWSKAEVEISQLSSQQGCFPFRDAFHQDPFLYKVKYTTVHIFKQKQLSIMSVMCQLLNQTGNAAVPCGKHIPYELTSQVNTLWTHMNYWWIYTVSDTWQ